MRRGIQSCADSSSCSCLDRYVALRQGRGRQPVAKGVVRNQAEVQGPARHHGGEAAAGEQHRATGGGGGGSDGDRDGAGPHRHPPVIRDVQRVLSGRSRRKHHLVRAPTCIEAGSDLLSIFHFLLFVRKKISTDGLPFDFLSCAAHARVGEAGAKAGEASAWGRPGSQQQQTTSSRQGRGKGREAGQG